ncbi:spore germination protein [Salirhabdus sp. Marseille-P4669]|uniref:spore germination protein n=1 Tax=Salirhabdus sp. Marseille-P4669 TaxID=2042310 RepID=UPI000C7B8707|nr:spore germination protein [Salirhabdus sp. Marseille-P4669]
MPAIVGAVKVNSISTSSIFHIGDVYAIAPTTSSKTFAGGGSFNSGNNIDIQVDQSYNYVFDSDKNDQLIVGNA